MAIPSPSMRIQRTLTNPASRMCLPRSRALSQAVTRPAASKPTTQESQLVRNPSTQRSTYICQQELPLVWYTQAGVLEPMSQTCTTDNKNMERPSCTTEARACRFRPLACSRIPLGVLVRTMDLGHRMLPEGRTAAAGRGPGRAPSWMLERGTVRTR